MTTSFLHHFLYQIEPHHHIHNNLSSIFHDSQSYKLLKEDFVTGHKGTNTIENILLLLIIPISFFLDSMLKYFLYPSISSTPLSRKKNLQHHSSGNYQQQQQQEEEEEEKEENQNEKIERNDDENMKQKKLSKENQKISSSLSTFYSLFRLLIELYGTRVMPVLLVQTLLSNQLYYLIPILIITIFLVFPLSLYLFDNKRFFDIFQFLSKQKVEIMNISKKKVFLSEYRSYMMISTCIAILAVDFPIFPRRFAKSEVFGISLMDLGVGSFVFSSSLVSQSARNVSRDTLHKSNQLNGFNPQRIIKMIKALIPLIILGTIRFVTHRGLNYQQHVSEYGVHWNFFFTLAIVSLVVNIIDMSLESMLLSCNEYVYFGIGLIVMMIHQSLLSLFEMQDFILFAPRQSIFSANKEGACTILGYVSIYYFGVGLGRCIFSCQTRIQWKRFLIKIFVAVVMLWIGRFVMDAALLEGNGQMVLVSSSKELEQIRHFQGDTQFMLTTTLVPSRMLVNAGYIHWVLAFNVSLVCVLSLLDFCFRREIPSQLREGINRSPLATFMCANLLTGVINLSFFTVVTRHWFGFAILNVYTFCFAMVSVYLDKKNITMLKL